MAETIQPTERHRGKIGRRVDAIRGMDVRKAVKTTLQYGFLLGTIGGAGGIAYTIWDSWGIDTDSPSYATSDGRANFNHTLQLANEALCGLVVTGGDDTRYAQADPKTADILIAGVMNDLPRTNELLGPLTQVRVDLYPELQNPTQPPCTEDVFVDDREVISGAMLTIDALRDDPVIRQEVARRNAAQDEYDRNNNLFYGSAGLFVGSGVGFFAADKIPSKTKKS